MTTPGRPTIWDRIDQGAERLLGLPSRGVLGPAAQDMARRQGLLALGSSLLQSSQPTVAPNTFSAALGRGLEAGRAGAAGGVQEGMALQQQMNQQQLEQARQAIFVKYQGQMDDPDALRQAANELASLGDMEGAKLVAGIADSLAPTGDKMPPLVAGVLPGAPAGTRPQQYERTPKGLRPIGLQVAAPSSDVLAVQSQYNAQAKQYRDSVDFGANMLSFADRAKGGDQAALIALARGFIDATTPQAAQFRANAEALAPAASWWDKLKDAATGRQTIIPQDQIDNVIAVMREMQRRNEASLWRLYQQYVPMVEWYGGQAAFLERPQLRYYQPEPGAAGSVGDFDSQRRRNP